MFQTVNPATHFSEKSLVKVTVSTSISSHEKTHLKIFFSKKALICQCFCNIRHVLLQRDFVIGGVSVRHAGNVHATRTPDG